MGHPQFKGCATREVPLASDTLAMLKAWRDRMKTASRWIFTNQNGQPEGHFLRKLKAIALAAGLNCGHCKTTIQKGDYENRHLVEVCCKQEAVCDNWTLHRFRKTRAIRWMERGVVIRKIQKWLGHKSLETTEIYLGSGNFDEADREKIDAA